MNYDELLNQIKRIHFIGIGGSGMCPLAEILHSEGFELTGSDMNEGDTLDRIKGYGIPVFMGHKAENIKGAELVVYSAAIKEDNPDKFSSILSLADNITFAFAPSGIVILTDIELSSFIFQVEMRLPKGVLTLTFTYLIPPSSLKGTSTSSPALQ